MAVHHGGDPGSAVTLTARPHHDPLLVTLLHDHGALLEFADSRIAACAG